MGYNALMQRALIPLSVLLILSVLLAVRPGHASAALDGNASIQTAPEPAPRRLEAILIEGNSITSERVIRRHLLTEIGQPLDERQARLSRRRLLALGYFRSVDFRLEKGTAEDRVILRIIVAERESVLIGEAWYGGAVGRRLLANEGFATGGLSVSDINLAGEGQTMTGALQATRPGILLANLRWSDPWILNGRWSISAEYLYVRRSDYFGEALANGPPDHTEDLLKIRTDAQGILMGGGYRTSGFNSLHLEFGYQNLFADYAGGNMADLDRRIKRGASRVNMLRASFHRDSRNDPFLPTEGQTIRAYYEVGVPPLGSNYVYNKVGMRATQYLPFFSSHSLAVTAESGYTDSARPFFIGFSAIDQLPNGGISDTRLEEEETPSTRTILLTQDYKRSFAQLDLLYSFPIFTYTGPFLYRIRGAVFTGAFDTWDVDESFFKEIYVPSGLAVHFDTAYGILNFRFALNFVASGESFGNLNRF